MKTAKLIINESYWHLFENKQFRTQSFIVPKIKIVNINNLSVAEYTRNLCLLLQDKDSGKSAKYGIEIKTNGSSRSARIPLVRHNKSTQSIWKISYKLRGVEKTIIELNELIYFLKKSRLNQELPLPYTVLFANFDEVEYTKNEKFSDYVKKQVQDNNIIWISSDFIRSLFENNKLVDLDSILSKNKSIYTKEPLI